MTDGETTRTEQLAAQYLVGCEGGSSFTRNWMGVQFEGKSPSTRWVVIDVWNDPLGTPNVYLGADPKRPYVSIGLPHAIRRWEFMLFDDEPSERVEDDAFVADLLKDHVPDSSSLDVIRRGAFTYDGRIASSFRKGRVLIAGDAAHLMPVWMGQGWNSGMRDATNLSWKLASALDGQAGQGILDTYDVERRDHAQAMIDLSMTFGTIIKPTDKRVAFLRDAAARALNVSPQVKAYFTDMRFKPMPRYSRGRRRRLGHPRPRPGEAEAHVPPHPGADSGQQDVPGRRAVHPAARQHPRRHRGAARRRTRRLVDGRGLGNHPARLFSEHDHAVLEKMGAQLVALTSETQRDWAEKELAAPGTLVVGDTNGDLKRWFDVHGVGVVFLRPDRFVAAACLAQQAPKALHAVIAAMSSTAQGGTS